MKPLSFSQVAFAVMLGILLADAARLLLLALYQFALKSIAV